MSYQQTKGWNVQIKNFWMNKYFVIKHRLAKHVCPYNWNIVESGVKHHQTNKQTNIFCF
jgi:hypothetical protein